MRAENTVNYVPNRRCKSWQLGSVLLVVKKKMCTAEKCVRKIILYARDAVTVATVHYVGLH